MTEEIGRRLFGEEWFKRLRNTVMSPEFGALGTFIASERSKFNVYPAKEDVFKAFIETPFDSVKCVIVGMDPYSNADSATGLAFANPKDTIIPQPSLKAIEAEVEDDCYGGFDFEHFLQPDLLNWAHQGVLLLNTALTVREKSPESHLEQWTFFTRAVITALNEGHSGLIWMLWGNKAKAYKPLISETAHHILEAGHPASGCYGKDLFTGCKHFTQANKLLLQMNGADAQIKW